MRSLCQVYLAVYRKHSVIASLFLPKIKEPLHCCLSCVSFVLNTPLVIFSTALTTPPHPFIFVADIWRLRSSINYWIVVIFIAMNATYNMIHSAPLSKSAYNYAISSTNNVTILSSKIITGKDAKETEK